MEAYCKTCEFTKIKFLSESRNFYLLPPLANRHSQVQPQLFDSKLALPYCDRTGFLSLE